jgi:hypothetical protein
MQLGSATKNQVGDGLADRRELCRDGLGEGREASASVSGLSLCLLGPDFRSEELQLQLGQLRNRAPLDLQAIGLELPRSLLRPLQAGEPVLDRRDGRRSDRSSGAGGLLIWIHCTSPAPGN